MKITVYKEKYKKQKEISSAFLNARNYLIKKYFLKKE